MNNAFSKIDIRYLIYAITCIILVATLFTVKDETSWTQWCEFTLAIGSILIAIFVIKSKILDGFKKYRNVLLVIIGVTVAIIYFKWNIYLWPIMTLILGIVISNVYTRNKSEISVAKKVDEMTKQLICLVICFILLFSIDSYYRQGEEMYGGGHLVKSTQTRFEIPNNGKGTIGVTEYRDTKLGNYFNVTYGVEGVRGHFRVFMEEGVNYGTPIIINKNVYAEIILKREGMNDLVYVIPYRN